MTKILKKYNTKVVKRKVLQSGVIHLAVIAIAVVIIAAAAFLFSDSGKGFISTSVGPPPTDPEERIAWLSENVDNNDHKTFIKLDYEVPSWEELDKINATVSRKYPSYIKAVQTYGTLPNLVESLYFGDVLKDLGVNTQFVHANYWLRNGELKLWYLGYDSPKDMSQDEAKRALVHNILLAKQQGLTVVLFPDHVQLEDGGMTEHNISPDELLALLEGIALELAPIAEKYNVDYFVPIAQVENLLTSNGYSVEETRDRTNALHAKVVPQVRQLFSGKIMYKMGGFNKWSNYDGVDLSGADIFGFTTCSRSPSPELVASEVQAASIQATKMSKEFGIPWLSIEFLINNPGDQVLLFDEVKTDYPIEDMYKIGLEEFNKFGSSASGFTVHSLLGAGKIYDTPAYPLVKDFFASK